MRGIIRKAQTADTAPIAALEREFFSCPRGEGEIGRALEQFWVAESREGDFLGYADAMSVLDEGYLGNIAVLPGQQGQGIGAALLGALLDWGRAQSLAFLTLEVREGNVPARQLYASRGFVTVGHRKNYYEKPTENAVLMTYYFKEGC